ncbi:MAG: hypothetical protein HYV09_11125 [Deltaproteobacteria bacterium]|nr:hypothetical protein [Deltaproteobacteria bacterium]
MTDGASSERARGARRLRGLATKVGPYLLTAIVVAAILRRYSLGEIVGAMARGHAWALFPIALAFAIIHMLIVSAWDTVVLTSVLGGPRYYDVARVKSGCAVLQSIGYLFNQGAYGTWIARSTGSGVRVAVGLILFTAGSDLAAGSLVATVTIALGRVPVGDLLRFGAPTLFASVMLLLLGQPREPFAETTLAERPGVLRVFRAVPRGRGAVQLFGRILNVVAIILAVWVAANAFGMPLPLRAAFMYVPIIMLVGSLPVNVLGFGPVQGAWLLFTEWVPGPQILAFSIVWNVALLVANLVRGGAFVPRILREVAAGTQPQSARVV